MKKIIILLLALVGIGAISCKKFLDEEPQSFYTSDNYYKSYQQAQNAVNGIYVFTRDFYAAVGLYEEDAMLMLENPTGQAKSDINQSNNNANLRNLTMQTTDLYFNVWWRSSYKGIDAANLAIQNIPLIPSSVVTDVQKNQLLGQAKFLRAWFYFNLVRIYGDVPLVIQPTTSAADLQVTRTGVKDVYEKLIVPDLLAAEQSGLPFSDQTGRVAVGAVKSLLAKVYQTMAGFPLQQKDKLALAKKEALEVINSGKYTLYQNYDQFRNAANDNKMENIFMVQFATGIATNPMFSNTLPSFSNISNGQQETGTLLPEDSFYASYTASDKRKEEKQFFYSHYPNFLTGTNVQFKNGQHVYKFWDDVAQASGQGSGKCFPIIRLSDIMLLYAEAQNEADGSPDANSYTYINAIRARANLTALAGLTQDQFRQAVWRERNHELCFENITWFDMVRTRMVYDTKNDAFVPMVGYTFPANNTAKFQMKHYLFPIPQMEIDANPKLTQNQGY
ncbi:RagB/SusD family nutrient uptake outer membrane protein [Pedobacter nototheniae]|uniref:RagB/SusD family nutrient uptake outer membrane protein n=1 Tax=Pedobacter nototheniae TaxID=2488994 RepID=UPI00292E3ED5|nr:RagB/SusD family nutrient uptake outer membrane protein [Pedobacter nototheniae]